MPPTTERLKEIEGHFSWTRTIIPGITDDMPDSPSRAIRELLEAVKERDDLIEAMANMVAQTLTWRDLSGMTLMACEAHPWREWPHDDCAGPGQPVATSLGVLKRALKAEARRPYRILVKEDGTWLHLKGPSKEALIRLEGDHGPIVNEAIAEVRALLTPPPPPQIWRDRYNDPPDPWPAPTAPLTMETYEGWKGSD